MAAYVAIPKLGMTMTEATLVEWKVKEGDRVEKGDIVLSIQTEKIKWDMEASASGYVHILVEVDVTAPVGRVVGLIAETAEDLEALQREPVREMFTTVPAAAAGPSAAPAPPTAGRAERPEGIRISPLARKMAEEHTIDITSVVGTGPGGRIVREDIERAIAEKEQAPAVEAYEGKTVKTTIPLKGMRKVIAEHMQRSLAVAAQLTMMGEIDMSEVIKLRSTLLEQKQSADTRVTFTDILVVVVARALQDHPIMNSSLIEDEIVIWEDINIGVAVALEDGLEGGLIVPVIRNADQRSLREIAAEVRTLVEKARTGKLLPDDVAGGTFTLTNLGAVGGGWGFGTPIINQPQSAILGAGSISDRPVVRDGQVVVRPIMTYSLTFDHRVIDGAAAAKFMARVSQLLEDPTLLPT
jgi:pyruvate dehydrogenase E2 component (dihydrolipoamide acetyltransferase)